MTWQPATATRARPAQRIEPPQPAGKANFGRLLVEDAKHFVPRQAEDLRQSLDRAGRRPVSSLRRAPGQRLSRDRQGSSLE
jgi:hypothetical protein